MKRHEYQTVNKHRVHIVNIITLPTGTKYMLDVAFGGSVATLLSPLPQGSGHISTNLGTQQIQLLLAPIPQQQQGAEIMDISVQE